MTKGITCIMIVFCFFFGGCYTESSLSRGDAVANDTKVFIYLKDGSCIKSYSDNHRRVADGYEVSGTITRKGNSIFGTAAISGVRRADDMESAAIARWITRKSVHQ